MKVSAQYAQEHFADILTAIDTGEEVELTAPGQPSVRLILVEPVSAIERPNGKRILGAGVGELRVPGFEERQAMDATLDWLLWYNGSRMHSTLRYLSPAQFERYAIASPLALAA